MRRLLIVGATGNVGQELVRVALEETSPFTHVRALARNASRIGHLQRETHSSKPATLELVDCDALDVEGLDAACKDVDAVICAYRGVPSLALDAQLLLLRAAERQGVQQMVLASWNYDVTKMKLGEHEPYDAYISMLARVEFVPKIKVLFIVSGVFFDVLWWFGIWEPERVDEAPATANSGGKFKTYGDADMVWKLTSRADAAHFAVEALRTGERSGVVYVASEQLSLNDISRLVAEVKGWASPRPVEILGDAQACHDALQEARARLGKARYLEYAWLGYIYYTITGRWDFEPRDNEPLLAGAPQRWRLSSLKEWMLENPDAIDCPPPKIQ